MIRDARHLPDGTTLQADVCIVGAGPAGITLAQALTGAHLDVVVLESGGLEEEPETRRLNAGDLAGVPYFPLDETRHRRLGGSTHRWAGWCRPLDPIDFERRPWVPHSGWPLSRDELAPYYERAAELCELPEAATAARAPALYRAPVTGGEVERVAYLASPPTKFGNAYRDDLERSRDVTLYLHATAVEVETDEQGRRAEAVRFGCLDGRRARVAAATFVLAAGALETARLLLVSRAARPAGLGNEHDLVGRFFADHPHVLTGHVAIAERAATGRPEFRSLDRGPAGARDRLRLRRPSQDAKFGYRVGDDEQRRRRLLNHSTHLVPVSGVDPQSPAYRSLALIAGNLRSPRRVVSQLRAGAIPDGIGHHLANLARSPGLVARAVYRELARRPRRMGLYTQAEQSPHPGSRVTLVDRRDALGVPRLKLDWRFAPGDRASIVATQEVLGARFRAAGIGTVEHAPWLVSGDTWGAGMTGGHHQLGTARMSDDPKRGVVDRNGRLHGVANVYVGDGAVFPTVGSANPLLTIVALALRTAAHLRSRSGPALR